MKILEEIDIDRMADELADLATTPQMLDSLEAVRQSPPAVMHSKAVEIASVDYLKVKGLKPPGGFRITTRTFEPPDQAENIVISPPVVTHDASRRTIEFCGWVITEEE